MDLVIAVDGGQTSCKCLLATTDGHVLGRAQGGPLIHLAAAGGPEQLQHTLRAALAAAWQSAGLVPEPVAAIALGLTGVPPGSAEAQTVRELVPQITQTNHLVITSDAFSALVGAHLGQPGVIVISGTGSIVLGLDARGSPVRAGGWGWLVGDEGSACAIGRTGLLAALQGYDNVGPKTRLLALMLEYFRVAAPEDVKRLVYAPDFGQRGFAALAPLVSQAAQQGDTVSAAIIREAGRALALQAGAVLRRLDVSALPVAPVGGAWEHVAGLTESFREALLTDWPTARLVAPQLPPVYGAVILALQAAALDWTRAIPHLQADVSS